MKPPASRKEDLSAIIENVRKYRKLRGWSKRATALKAGYSEFWLTGLEKGRIYPSISSLFSLAKVFNIPVWRLFYDERIAKEENKLLKPLENFIKERDLSPKDIEKLIRVGEMLFSNKKD